jgi:hypothetical protein
MAGFGPPRDELDPHGRWSPAHALSRLAVLFLMMCLEIVLMAKYVSFLKIVSMVKIVL